MSEPESIFQFRLALTDSFPEIWRRVLVPDEFTLGSSCDEVGWSGFEPAYLYIGDINGALGLIFPAGDAEYPPVNPGPSGCRVNAD